MTTASAQIASATTVEEETVEEQTIEEQQEEVERQLQETESKKNQTETDKANAEQTVDALEQEAEALEDNYNSLNSQLASVESSIASTESAIATTTEDILEIQQELVEAQDQRDEQYENMKKRMQFVYENGTTQSWLVSLFSSESLADLLKRAEYIVSIVEYDRQMVDAYEELVETIAAKSEELTAKKEELTSYQETLSSQQDTLDALIVEAGDAYTSKQNEVSAAKYTVEEYTALIAQYDAEAASLEAKQAELMALAAQQYTESLGESGAEDTTGALSGYTEADLRILTCIIYAEARGESYEGQLAVGSVVMNRVMSSKFPNTIYDVVYQTNQFQPVRDGHLDTAYDLYDNGDASYGTNYTAMQSCKQAAIQVLNGYRSGDWLFFMTQTWADYYGITGYTMIGNHAFFRVWGAN